MKIRSTLVVTAWVVAISTVGIFLFKNDIAEILFLRTIERTVSWDRRDDLEPGLHVAFCGTGTPLPDLNRGGGCTAVLAGQRIFLFDAGEGAAESLALMGILPSDVEAVFLTHFHSDHINGLGALAIQHVFRGSVSEPLPIYGGQGVDRVVKGFNAAYALDHEYRVRHHGAVAAPPSGFELLARTMDIPVSGSAVVYENEGVRISAFNVIHQSVDPALGYRIDYQGRSVAISGDTEYSDNLVAAANSVDLMVHEALSPQLVKQIEAVALKHGRNGLATVMHDIPSYHTPPIDAARAAQNSGTKVLALTHLIPGVPAGGFFDELFLGDAVNEFDGDIWIMSDGEVISLPVSGGIERL